MRYHFRRLFKLDVLPVGHLYLGGIPVMTCTIASVFERGGQNCGNPDNNHHRFAHSRGAATTLHGHLMHYGRAGPPEMELCTSFSDPLILASLRLRQVILVEIAAGFTVGCLPL